ncbi:MAG: hypothetical protein AB9M60_13445 [Leptothrix sp. (in: b-proteobacteria)]
MTNPDGSVQVLAGQVEKGPLLRGSTVTINTLTTASVALAAGTTTVLPGTTATTLPALVPSGASFTMEVKDDFGTFAPQSAAIFQSAFIETNAEGYYFNELTGQRSDDIIALRGVSNLKSDKAINVNLLTDLAKERTLALARAAAAAATTAPGNVTPAIFDAARKQAQLETLRAFNIDSRELGTVNAFAELDLKKISTEATARPADNILLALSALVVQIGQDGSGVSDFQNRFEADLADNGVIDDATLKNQILKASATVDFNRVAANMNTFYNTGKYVAADIAQWVDRSGGVIGVLQKDVQYIPNLMYSAGSVYESRLYSVPGTATPACYGAEMNDAKLGSVQLVDGTTVLTAAKIYPVAAAAASLKLRFTPTSPNAVGFLVRWDAVSGACSSTSQPNKAKLLAYAAVPTDVGLFLNKLTADFARCFALPVTSRVLGVDNTIPAGQGGPTVTAVADVCKPLASSVDRTGTEFLQNGYSAGQFFYNMLNDTSLTKSALVKDVAILRSSTAAGAPMAPNPALVLNVKYLDRYSRMGNVILVAQKLAGTSPESGDWSVTGNQQPVEISVVPQLRKFTSLAGYTSATPSIKEHYRSGIGFFIYPFGPGGRLADGSALSAVRISGSGLAGLVYVPPVQPGQTWMDLSNISGDVATASAKRCGATVGTGGPVWTNCPNYWIARTTSVVPSSAAPVKRTPTATEGSCNSTTVNQTCAWGGTWSPTDISASLTQNAPFTVELFYGGRTTPSLTYTKYLNSTLPDLTKAGTAGWVALDTATLASAQPVAGQTVLNLSWTGQVANAVEVKSATATLNNSGATVATPDDPVARGSNFVTIATDAEIQYAVPASSPGSTSLRGILLNLRTWDGSARSQWLSYDTAN